MIYPEVAFAATSYLADLVQLLVGQIENDEGVQALVTISCINELITTESKLASAYVHSIATDRQMFGLLADAREVTESAPAEILRAEFRQRLAGIIEQHEREAS